MLLSIGSLILKSPVNGISWAIFVSETKALSSGSNSGLLHAAVSCMWATSQAMETVSCLYLSFPHHWGYVPPPQGRLAY